MVEAGDNLHVELSAARGKSEFRRSLRFVWRSRSTVVGVALTGIFLFVAIAAPWLAPYDPLGNDANGRDLLSRIIYGDRTSMWIGLTATGLAMLSGVILGLVSAFYGGMWDMGIMRLVDVLLTFPPLILSIALISVLGKGTNNLILAVSIAMLPIFARLARGTVLAVRENDYVKAAQSVGASDWRVMTRHLLPNSWGPIIVQATLGIGMAVLAAASLSFLGLGVQPPEPEWGSMLSQAREYIRYAPHFIAFPGAALALFVLGFNLMGDGLRDVLDPRLRKQ
jgi:peptide/nickel transport system permease protein